MKKIWILVLMVSLLSLVACSKPEDVEVESVDKEVELVKTEAVDEETADDSYFVQDDKVLEVGLIAPNFSLENLDLEGGNLTLEDYRGKYVLINFWATWCVYCIEEMPDLQAFSEENEDLVVIAVNVEESRELVEKYIKEGGYTFDVALDSDGDLSKAYFISSFPTSIFIDRDGNLIGGVQGLMAKEDMEKVLDYVKEQEAILRNN